MVLRSLVQTVWEQLLPPSGGPGGGPGGKLALEDLPARRLGPQLLVGLAMRADHTQSWTRAQPRASSDQNSAFSLHLQ